MKNFVRRIIQNRTPLQVQLDVCKSILLERPDDDETAHQATTLQNKLDIITAWLSLLGERDYYIVERHLILHHNWDKVADEYEQEFGFMCVKSLRQHQKNALEAIADVAILNRRSLVKLFADVNTTKN